MPSELSFPVVRLLLGGTTMSLGVEDRNKTICEDGVLID